MVNRPQSWYVKKWGWTHKVWAHWPSEPPRPLWLHVLAIDSTIKTKQTKNKKLHWFIWMVTPHHEATWYRIYYTHIYTTHIYRKCFPHHSLTQKTWRISNGLKKWQLLPPPRRLFLPLCVCVSVSRITRNAVDEFWRKFFGRGGISYVTSNSWLPSSGDLDYNAVTGNFNRQKEHIVRILRIHYCPDGGLRCPRASILVHCSVHCGTKSICTSLKELHSVGFKHKIEKFLFNTTD